MQIIIQDKLIELQVGINPHPNSFFNHNEPLPLIVTRYSTPYQVIAGLPIPLDQMPAEEQMMLLGGPPLKGVHGVGVSSNGGQSSHLVASSRDGGGRDDAEGDARVAPQLYTGTTARYAKQL